jgi:hypothetical protein
MDIDSSGNVYIAGESYDGTVDYPTKSGAYMTHLSAYDAFVTKLPNDLSDITASTFLPGDG